MSSKPSILHLGDPCRWHADLYKKLETHFTIIRPSAEERERTAFLAGLKEKRWGNFVAIMRPFWNTGGEMGRIDRELISLLPDSVKVYASAGAGFDWVDTDILAEKGIIYCNGAAASSDSVADSALFLIISTFRNLAWSQMAARSGNPDELFDAHKNSPTTAINPAGRVLGIVGLGNIGYRIAQKAYLGLNMKIAYHDLFRKPKSVEEAVGATFYETLDEMLAVADCILVATPFSGKQLFTTEKFKKFKRGSRLINIARGPLVNEADLVEALKSGQLSACGLDVFENEPHVNKELCGLKQATLTAHTAGGTIDTHIGFEELCYKNVLGALLEGKAITPVNLHLIKAGKSKL
ncbi:glyoxylate/hydroxypyruvate reductase, partial [Aureobasidium melanogenum]